MESSNFTKILPVRPLISRRPKKRKTKSRKNHADKRYELLVNHIYKSSCDEAYREFSHFYQIHNPQSFLEVLKIMVISIAKLHRIRYDFDRRYDYKQHFDHHAQDWQEEYFKLPDWRKSNVDIFIHYDSNEPLQNCYSIYEDRCLIVFWNLKANKSKNVLLSRLEPIAPIDQRIINLDKAALFDISRAINDCLRSHSSTSSSILTETKVKVEGTPPSPSSSILVESEAKVEETPPPSPSSSISAETKAEETPPSSPSSSISTEPQVKAKETTPSLSSSSVSTETGGKAEETLQTATNSSISTETETKTGETPSGDEGARADAFIEPLPPSDGQFKKPGVFKLRLKRSRKAS